MNHHLIIIAGPTAVGKTALSVELAKYYQCPVISADSRQFYKEISIGTAKPSIEEMDGIVHYFIDNKSIDEDYNIECNCCIDPVYHTYELAHNLLSIFL